MTRPDRVTLARSFGRGARAYERRRLPYPAELFADIVALSGRRWGGRVLEVGAGTGRATIPLARAGAHVDAVEPSADMVSTLLGTIEAEGLGDRVSVHRATFEDLAPATSWPVVVAAQSFHWTDPETRWRRLASVLEPDGLAFLFWNDRILDPEHHDHQRIRNLFDEHGEGLSPDLPRTATTIPWAVDEVDRSAEVQLAEVRTYAWAHEMGADAYRGLLETTSQFAVAGVKDALFSHLAAELGDTVHLRGSTLLLVVEAT